MAFDVYVGTMTRYYRREWENAAQRQARAQGIIHKTVYPGGQAPAIPAPEEIRKAVTTWCAAMSAALQPHRVPPISWDESDQTPYFTEQPAWDGYSALLVWTAHAEHPDLPWPTNVPKLWADDPAFQRSFDPSSKTQYRTILAPQLWLPAEFPFVFDGGTLTKKKECIGSTFTLRTQLQNLQRATADRLVSASAGGGDQRPPLAAGAAQALKLFTELAKHACAHRLPMLLDF